MRILKKLERLMGDKKIAQGYADSLRKLVFDGGYLNQRSQEVTSEKRKLYTLGECHPGGLERAAYIARQLILQIENSSQLPEWYSQGVVPRVKRMAKRLIHLKQEIRRLEFLFYKNFEPDGFFLEGTCDENLGDRVPAVSYMRRYRQRQIPIVYLDDNNPHYSSLLDESEPKNSMEKEELQRNRENYWVEQIGKNVRGLDLHKSILRIGAHHVLNSYGLKDALNNQDVDALTLNPTFVEIVNIRIPSRLSNNSEPRPSEISC